MSVGVCIIELLRKAGYARTRNGETMMFYNGFNLLLDIVFVYIAYRIGKSFGYRQGEADNAPPF